MILGPKIDQIFSVRAFGSRERLSPSIGMSCAQHRFIRESVLLAYLEKVIGAKRTRVFHDLSIKIVQNFCFHSFGSTHSQER